MANSFSPTLLLGSLRTLVTPTFWIVLLVATAMMFIRKLLDWPILPLDFTWVGQVIRFEIGAALGIFLISAHQTWLSFVLSLLPGTQEEDTGAVDTLRSPVMFLVLPVVIFLLVLTPPAWIGLGVLWAIATWYALEAWALLQNQPEVLARYFPQLQQVQQDAVYHVVVWTYLIIWLGFSFVLVVR